MANDYSELAKRLFDEEMNVVSDEMYEMLARNIFRMYRSYVDVGFSDDQAMMLVIAQMNIAAGVGRNAGRQDS